MQVKTSLSKVTQFFGSGATILAKSAGRKNRTPTNNGKHPYLRSDFWLNPLNQFWNSDLYSESSREQLRNGIGV